MGSLFSGNVKDNSAIQQGNGPVQVTGPVDALRIANDRVQAYAGSQMPVAGLGNDAKASTGADGELQFSAPSLRFDTSSAPQQATKIVTPTAKEAMDEGGFASPGLTTKGKVLGALLTLGQGAGIGAGQNGFGGGFRAETQFLNDQRDREIHNKALAQEEILRQNQIEQGPLLFQLGVKDKLGDIKRNDAQVKYLEAGAQRRLRTKGDDLQDKIDAAMAAGLEPGTPEYNQAVYGNALQDKPPSTEAGLAFVGAGAGARAEQANKALGALGNKQKDVKKAPGAPKSGPTATHVRGQATVAASQFLQKHGGDAEAAIADFQAQLPAAIAKNPAVEDAAPYIVQEIKRAGKKKAAKPSLTFTGTN